MPLGPKVRGTPFASGAFAGKSIAREIVVGPAGRSFAGRPVSSFRLVIESPQYAGHCLVRRGRLQSRERDARSARPEAPMLESAPASARPLLLTTVLDVAADEFLGAFFEHAIDLVQQGVELGADLLALRSDAALIGGIAAVLHRSRRLSLPRLSAHDLPPSPQNLFTALAFMTTQTLCHEAGEEGAGDRSNLPGTIRTLDDPRGSISIICGRPCGPSPLRFFASPPRARRRGEAQARLDRLEPCESGRTAR